MNEGTPEFAFLVGITMATSVWLLSAIHFKSEGLFVASALGAAVMLGFIVGWVVENIS